MRSLHPFSSSTVTTIAPRALALPRLPWPAVKNLPSRLSSPQGQVVIFLLSSSGRIQLIAVNMRMYIRWFHSSLH